MDGSKVIAIAGPLLILGGSALVKREQRPLRVTLVVAGSLAMLYSCCRDYMKGVS